METKQLTLSWSRVYEINELSKAFAQDLKNKGGLYLWVEGKSNPRVSYIGEAENFENRFKEHFKNIIHGLYTAVPENNDDLLDSYYKLLKNEECKYYHPKSIVFSENFEREIEREIKKIKEGIDLKIKHLRNTRFLFAKIAENQADKRKEIEAIFMQKMHKKYFEIIDKKHPAELKDLHWKKNKQTDSGFSRSNTNFWGTISKNPDKNCSYEIINNFSSVEEKIKEELEEIYGETIWWPSK